MLGTFDFTLYFTASNAGGLSKVKKLSNSILHDLCYKRINLTFSLLVGRSETNKLFVFGQSKDIESILSSAILT